jgi:PadR family transcriptional regulator PadR
MAIVGLDENARKKGSAEILVLAQLDGVLRHAHEIGVEIERRSEGVVSFQTASLYPVLYRLERKGLIVGEWVEAAGQRRRMYYKLTPEGQRVLSEQRRDWSAFLIALQRAAGLENASLPHMRALESPRSGISDVPEIS